MALDRFAGGLPGRVLAKLEGSIPRAARRTRAAAQMILSAEAEGKLRPGATIIEPTSGNTGIGLAAIGGARGYRVVIVMPDSMSVERRNLMRAYGAELVLTPGAEGMRGAIARAEALANDIPGAWIAGPVRQSGEPRGALPDDRAEIWRDTDGRVGAFVAGVGTGGTISGVGRYLKAQNPAVRVVAVEPEKSPVLRGGAPAAHAIQGIGANFVPGNYDASVVDEGLRCVRC